MNHNWFVVIVERSAQNGGKKRDSRCKEIIKTANTVGDQSLVPAIKAVGQTCCDDAQRRHNGAFIPYFCDGERTDHPELLSKQIGRRRLTAIGGGEMGELIELAAVWRR